VEAVVRSILEDHVADPMMDVATAARLMGLRPQTLYNWHGHTRGPRPVKLGAGKGAQLRYARSHVAAWLADPARYEREVWGDDVAAVEA
jgi:predicted DNA-binding transcriptional regulator AlpA